MPWGSGARVVRSAVQSKPEWREVRTSALPCFAVAKSEYLQDVAAQLHAQWISWPELTVILEGMPTWVTTSNPAQQQKAMATTFHNHAQGHQGRISKYKARSTVKPILKK